MEVFSRVKGETWLVCFVGYTISDSCTKHEIRALHVVVHHVFKRRLESFFVYHIKVYFFICDNLNSYITSDEVNLSSHIVKLFILHPKVCFFIFFEEKNWTWWSYNESLVKEKIHGSKIRISDLFNWAFNWFKSIDSQAISLAVKCSAILGHWWVKWLYWEVSLWATCILDFSHYWLTEWFLLVEWVQEMILSLLKSMIAWYEKIIICDKSACNQWLPETSNWFRLVIKWE